MNVFFLKLKKKHTNDCQVLLLRVAELEKCFDQVLERFYSNHFDHSNSVLSAVSLSEYLSTRIIKDKSSY